ncbi:MAG: 50S ribosomal protein L6 [Candidatus Parcubacteria bacterium]|jgi:large subunit ribosomal protein L6|nr:50S ribosomal protein L6 [Candidatus Parcubacteria bacterium]
MSRIGKKPITLPEGITAKIENNVLLIKGPKGELKQKIHPLVKIAEKDKQLIITVTDPTVKFQKALWGLFGSLIKNMVQGVKEGFEKKLEVIGVGYKVNLQGKKLVLNVGFSHPVEFVVPEDITANVEKNIISIFGIDKHQVGEVAASIRRIKKPEPYKGKGIKYIDEVIKKKVGKAAAKAAA